MNGNESLKPCPFCGEEAEIERLGTPRQSTIYACTNCGCRLETGEEWSHGRDWNTRDPDPDALVALEAAQRRIEVLDLLDELRAKEGHSVTLCHDNPDFGGYNCTIIFSADYGQDDVQFFGDTVLDCLRQAKAALEAK